MDEKLIGVIVLMMCCICSSIIAATMGGGEDDSSGGAGGAGAGAEPTKYVYDIHLVSKTEHGNHGSVISDIKIDGTRISKDEITFNIPPTLYDCNHDTDRSYDCKGEMGYLDSGGHITMAAWNKHNPPEKFFTITTDKKVKEIEITWHRPTYAPAIMIKENGKEVVKDTSNHGNKLTPSPYPVKYTIP